MPLDPQFRQALKRAHRGLKDNDIDRLEELVSERFRINPEREPERLRALDAEREALLSRAMPRYQEVWQRFQAGEPNGRGRRQRKRA